MSQSMFTSRRYFAWFATLAAGILMLTLPVMPVLAQVAGIPAFNISEGEGGSTYTLSLQILALMTALTLLPSLVLGMTSFTGSSSCCRSCDRRWEPSRHHRIRFWSPLRSF